MSNYSLANEPVLVQYPSNEVVKIILNRPSALNAINVDLLSGLVQALRENATAKVIVLEGAGDRSFCAGEDLKQSLAPNTGSAEELKLAFEMLQDITRLTASSSAIVIAAVQGFAIGGGAEIALAADFVIGGPGARFRFPEVPIGHAATGGITGRLVALVGLLKAKELLLTGRFIDADEAVKIGLLTEIAQSPKDRAFELALQLAQLPSVSLTSSKSSLERAVFPNLEECLKDEIDVASYCFAQSDSSRAFSDFAARKANKSDAVNLAPATVSYPERSQQDDVQHSPIRDINTAFARAVQAFPSRVFIRFGGEDFTFGDIESCVAHLASGLQKFDIQPQDRVLVMMKNSVEMVCTWFATNRLGAVWVPINTSLKSVSLKHVIEAAAPKLAILDEDFFTDVSSLKVVSPERVIVNDKSAGLSGLLVHGVVTTAAQVTPATTAAFLFTSGTTGKSKACIMSHEYFILEARALIECCTLRDSDVLYCPFPLFHADATALTVIPALLLGAVAALSIRYSASRFWDEIRDTKATIYDFMGATLALTYKQPPSPLDRNHNVRLAWGVPIPSFATEYEKRFGHPLITLYGSVETSLPIIQQGLLPAGSCGRLRRGYHLRIANEFDEELPPNTPGHLLLRCDVPNAFFGGYFGDPKSTLAAFSNLWLHTGDLAKVDEKGNIFFVGRVKDVIRRRGENVNAAEVEEEFLQHPAVILAAAYGIPSQLGVGTEEEVKVAVVVRTGSSITERELWQWSLKRMARFQVPAVIEIVPDIKRTPTGKMEKHGLKVEGGQRFNIKEEWLPSRL